MLPVLDGGAAGHLFAPDNVCVIGEEGFCQVLESRDLVVPSSIFCVALACSLGEMVVLLDTFLPLTMLVSLFNIFFIKFWHPGW